MVPVSLIGTLSKVGLRYVLQDVPVVQFPATVRKFYRAFQHDRKVLHSLQQRSISLPLYQNQKQLN